MIRAKRGHVKVDHEAWSRRWFLYTKTSFRVYCYPHTSRNLMVFCYIYDNMQACTYLRFYTERNSNMHIHMLVLQLRLNYTLEFLLKVPSTISRSLINKINKIKQFCHNYIIILLILKMHLVINNPAFFTRFLNINRIFWMKISKHN